jgi:predicted RNA-binding Zn ribbon-like protein
LWDQSRFLQAQSKFATEASSGVFAVSGLYQHLLEWFKAVTSSASAMLDEMSKNSRSVEKRGVFLASDPALDFLNTEWPTATGREDFFETDEDVFNWLRQAGLAADGVEEVRPAGALLRAARALRAVLRTLVESRKVGKAPEFSDLNAFLVAAQSHPQLVWTKSKSIALKTIHAAGTAEQVLAPVTLKAAELLSTADFRRVRRCGEQTCVHWFLDTTRPGRRRWCSMATCGNRLKVKSYRLRLKIS